MEREFNRENLQGIYRLLTEIAKGNFAYKIRRSRYNDELEALITYFNQAAQELYRTRNQFLWINRENEAVKIRTAHFVLDHQFKIQKLSYDTPGNKLVKAVDFVGKPFEILLVKSFRKQWRKKIKSLKKSRRMSFFIKLEYHFDSFVNIDLDSVVSRFISDKMEEYIVTSFLLETSKDIALVTSNNIALKTFSIWDQKLLKEIQVYIEHHLEEPLVSIDELALKFQTNTHKIINGFKELFGCTPFQYHARQRIERCKFLIEYSELNLMEISIKMGYGSYPNFSKRFKNITQISPKRYRDIVRKS